MYRRRGDELLYIKKGYGVVKEQSQAHLFLKKNKSEQMDFGGKMNIEWILPIYVIATKIDFHASL